MSLWRRLNIRIAAQHPVYFISGIHVFMTVCDSRMGFLCRLTLTRHLTETVFLPFQRISAAIKADLPTPA